MRWRGLARRAIPFMVAAAGGFLLAYLIVAFIIFPATLIPSDVKIPNVVGMRYSDASKRLRESGFAVARGESRYHADAPAGTVLGQNPVAGGVEPKGTEIVLDLSRGQRKAEVPGVIGMSQAQAEAVLQNAGLQVGEVSEREASLPRGQILASQPVAGERVALSSVVDLVISTGPATVEVPDVVGQAYADARSLLGQLGLKVGGVVTDSLSPMPVNTVLAQTPAAGQAVAGGTEVSLTIAGRARQ